MPIPRIYQPVSLTPDTRVQLDETASHHLMRVLRVALHETVILFNGELWQHQQGEFECRIIQFDKKKVTVDIVRFIAREVEAPVRLHLAQAIARGEKMDWILQKAVELGVTQITPLITARCNVRLDDKREEKRLTHWQAVIVSACEQSGRNQLPVIAAPVLLEKWLLQPNEVVGTYRFVLSPHQQHQHQQQRPATLPSQALITLLIGPEGGLSETEVNAAVQHGFIPLTLGPRILRTETAAIAAIAIFQSWYGDMSA